MGVEYNIVRKSGSWYTYEGDQLGQGKEKARQFLKDNPEMCDELDHLIRVHAGLVEEDDVPEAPKAPKAPAAPKEEE
jgi:recombination protein RecA